MNLIKAVRLVLADVHKTDPDMSIDEIVAGLRYMGGMEVPGEQPDLALAYQTVETASRSDITAAIEIISSSTTLVVEGEHTIK